MNKKQGILERFKASLFKVSFKRALSYFLIGLLGGLQIALGGAINFGNSLDQIEGPGSHPLKIRTKGEYRVFYPEIISGQRLDKLSLKIYDKDGTEIPCLETYQPESILEFPYDPELIVQSFEIPSEGNYTLLAPEVANVKPKKLTIAGSHLSQAYGLRVAVVTGLATLLIFWIWAGFIFRAAWRRRYSES